MEEHMKYAIILALSIAFVACPAGKTKLTTEQLGKTNNAARSFYSAQMIGKKQGVSLGCSGIDSDNDGNVTCTGQVPTNEEGAMRFQETICSYEDAAGCKLK
jgi:hypothetical protein